MMLVLMIGTAMMAITVAIHVLGSARWLIFVGRWLAGHTRQAQTAPLFLIMLGTATALLLLHALEALLWALVYYGMPERSGLTDFAEALYFSLVTLTTLGYGDVTLNTDLRLLAGMEAMVGIVVFGMTTALLMAVIQRSWKITRRNPK